MDMTTSGSLAPRCRGCWIALLIGLTVSVTLPALASQRADVQTSQPQPDATQRAEPAHAEGKLKKGESAKIELPEQAVTASFDGEELKEDLDLRAEELPETATAAAQSETGLITLGGGISLDAANAAGIEVSSFPHQVEIVPATPDQPGYVKSFEPAIELVTALTPDQVGTLERSSIAMYSRDAPGAPWVRLPSAFDPDTNTVVAHSDHLSEFIVMGSSAVASSGPRVVLDTDDDVGHALWNGVTQREVTFNVRLANALAPVLEESCGANVLQTRPSAADRFVSRDLRRMMANNHNPDLTVTIAFNALTGFPWGVESDGGVRAWANGPTGNHQLAQEFLSRVRQYTGRPSTRGVQGDNGLLPYDEFDGLAGSYAHIEMLFLDHNFDWPVIDTGFQYIVNGAAAAIAARLRAAGFNCTDPDDPISGFPQPPSAEVLARLRNLGRQNFQRYGADPVSFSTGNLAAEEMLFKLTGVGDQVLDMTLHYNAQDGRPNRVGPGWQFAYGSYTQRYSDDSATVTLHDGRTFYYTRAGGGFVTPSGAFMDLTEPTPGQLLLTAADTSTWLFMQDETTGRGRLVEMTDRQGNRTSLTYDESSGSEFVALRAISDEAGQTIAVETDENGQITQFEHPDGRTWQLAYSVQGDLTEITDPRSLRRSFTYDDRHRLLSATGADGVTYLTNTYDDQDRVTQQVDARGGIRSFAYAPGRTTFTDALGRQSVYEFDSQGRVTRVTDSLGLVEESVYDDNYLTTRRSDGNGHGSNTTYDASGRPLVVTDAVGSARHFTYTPQGDLATFTDSGGPGGAARTTVLDVNQDGRPTTTHRPDGSTIPTAYDDHGDPTSIFNARGGALTLEYDGRGNVVRAVDPAGGVTANIYDLANRRTSVTDANGGVTQLDFDAGDNVTAVTDALGEVERLSYDANDSVVSHTDANGHSTAMAYDASLNPTSETAADGGTTTFSNDPEDNRVSETDPLGNTTLFTLDARDRLVERRDANGNTWRSTYDLAGNLVGSTDPLGHVTTYTYDAVNRQTSIAAADGGVAKVVYDTVGRPTEVIDPNGGVIRYGYDLLDRTVTETDQEGRLTSRTFDPDGNLVGLTDRVGQVWSYEHDAVDRLIKEQDPLGGTTSLGYDPVGNLTARTDPNGHTWTFRFDALHRQVSQADPLGNTASAGYDSVGNLIGAIDANGHARALTYDPVNRQLTEADPLGNVTAWRYDLAGRRRAMVAADGVTTDYSYDPLGQMTQVVENAVSGGPSNADTNVTSRYGYDEAGRLVTVTDPNGHVTKFTYDGVGRRTGETNPLGRVWKRIYDRAGNLTERTDAKGATAKYSYTPDHQLAVIREPDGSSITQRHDGENRLVEMTDRLGTARWTLDAAGRTVMATDSLGRTLRYGYDASGNRTSMVFPNSATVALTWDAANRPSSQATPWGTAAFTFDPADNLVAQSTSGGGNTTYAYDAANRLVTQAVSGLSGAGPKDDTAPGSPPPDIPARLAYEYDRVANVVTRSQELGKAADTSHYTYDPLRRLVGSETNGSRTSYTFDAAGNRTALRGDDNPFTPKPDDPLIQTSTHNAANQLTKVVSESPGQKNQGSTDTLTYDANGNRTKLVRKPDKGNTTTTDYRYDFENRLSSVEQHNRSVAFSYDGQGRRTAGSGRYRGQPQDH